MIQYNCTVVCSYCTGKILFCISFNYIAQYCVLDIYDVMMTSWCVATAAPPSVQPIYIDLSSNNTQIVTSLNEVVPTNYIQRLFSPVPIFIATEMGHGLVHSILFLARADGFKNSLVYGKKSCLV